jgi:hypothetical protein
MQSSYPGGVKVLASQVKKLLKLSIGSQYEECFKSPNQGAVNAAILHMPPAVRKKLKVEDVFKKLSDITTKKEARAKVPRPTWKEVAEVLDKKAPKVSSSTGGTITLKYSIRIRGFPIKFSLHSGYTRSEDEYTSYVVTNKASSNKKQYQLDSSFLRYCSSKGFISNVKKIARLANLGFDRSLVNTELLYSKDLNDKILQFALLKASPLQKGDVPLTKESLAILLIDGNEAIRELAKSKWKKLHKQEQKELSKPKLGSLSRKLAFDYTMQDRLDREAVRVYEDFFKKETV